MLFLRISRSSRTNAFDLEWAFMAGYFLVSNLCAALIQSLNNKSPLTMVCLTFA